MVVHPVPPYALAWAAGFVLAAGCDRRVTVYEKDGHIQKQFDYNSEHEFTVACCSPSGQAVAVGSFNRYTLYKFN